MKSRRYAPMANGSVPCCQDEETSRRAALNHAVLFAAIMR
jgi:hypothetical protein